MAIRSYQIEGNVIIRFLVNRIILDDVLSSIIIVITLLKTIITIKQQQQQSVMFWLCFPPSKGPICI